MFAVGDADVADAVGDAADGHAGGQGEGGETDARDEGDLLEKDPAFKIEEDANGQPGGVEEDWRAIHVNNDHKGRRGKHTPDDCPHSPIQPKRPRPRTTHIQIHTVRRIVIAINIRLAPNRYHQRQTHQH